MIKLAITSQSLAGFNTSITLISQKVSRQADVALTEATEAIFNAAQLKVPVQTGALRSSGKITEDNHNNILQRTISYGDETLNPKTGRLTSTYAVRVHEVLNELHPEGYKWLEKSLYQNMESFSQQLASALHL